jgi:hypothetical protein
MRAANTADRLTLRQPGSIGQSCLHIAYKPSGQEKSTQALLR